MVSICIRTFAEHPVALSSQIAAPCGAVAPLDGVLRSDGRASISVAPPKPPKEPQDSFWSFWLPTVAPGSAEACPEPAVEAATATAKTGSTRCTSTPKRDRGPA